MSKLCWQLHQLAHQLARYNFPFADAQIPPNGIYLLFEWGEEGHGGDRIVRIGTHRKQGQLPGRMGEHFLNENKDRSIFRKNIGRTILNQRDDPYLKAWNIDTLSRKAREQYSAVIDRDYQQQIEAQVTQYIQKNLLFVVVPLETWDERRWFEQRIISTISLCTVCRPSLGWFGQWSPIPKIRESGLWQVQHLYQQPLSAAEYARLVHAAIG